MFQRLQTGGPPAPPSRALRLAALLLPVATFLAAVGLGACLRTWAFLIPWSIVLVLVSSRLRAHVTGLLMIKGVFRSAAIAKAKLDDDPHVAEVECREVEIDDWSRAGTMMRALLRHSLWRFELLYGASNLVLVTLGATAGRFMTGLPVWNGWR